jgi:hypothetical protein
MRPRTPGRLAVTLAATLASADALPEAVPAHAGPAEAGIWKAVVPPPGSMHGEFASHDPVGLAAGVKVPADCSINWVDPDERSLYCFASATSLVLFLEAPHAYLARARTQWLHLNDR